MLTPSKQYCIMFHVTGTYTLSLQVFLKLHFSYFSLTFSSLFFKYQWCPCALPDLSVSTFWVSGFFPHQRFSPVMLQVLNFLLCKVQLCSHSTFLTFPTNFLRYVMYKMYGTTSVSWRFKQSTIATDTDNENSFSVSYLKESFVPAGNRWINFKALRHRIRIPFCFSPWHYSISVYTVLYYTKFTVL